MRERCQMALYNNTLSRGISFQILTNVPVARATMAERVLTKETISNATASLISTQG